MSLSFLGRLIEDNRNAIGDMAQLTSDNLDIISKSLGKKKSQNFDLVASNKQNIDRIHAEISRSLFKILARQSPVAGDLRMVLSLSRTNDSLERIGHLTQSLSFDLKDYFKNPPLEILGEICRMSNLCVLMMKQGLQCFFDKDPALASEVLVMDKQVNQFRNDLMVSLKDAMKMSPTLVEGGFYLVSVVRKLERIGDLTASVAEEVIFSATGHNIRNQLHFSLENDGFSAGAGAGTMDAEIESPRHTAGVTLPFNSFSQGGDDGSTFES